MSTRPVLVLSKRQCQILSYAKRRAVRNLARACDPVIPIIVVERGSLTNSYGRSGYKSTIAVLVAA